MTTPVQLGNRWFFPQVETRMIVMPPVTTNERLSLRSNAYLLQNAGNCNLTLDNGYTLEPGQNMWLGNYQELNVLNIDTSVTFLPATATSEPPVQRLEIIEVQTKFVGSGNWVNQPPMDNTNTAPQ